MLVTEVLKEVEVSVKIKALNVKVEMFFLGSFPGRQILSLWVRGRPDLQTQSYRFNLKNCSFNITVYVRALKD